MFQKLPGTKLLSSFGESWTEKRQFFFFHKAEIHFRNFDVWERLRAKQGCEDDMCLAALFLLLKDLEV